MFKGGGEVLDPSPLFPLWEVHMWLLLPAACSSDRDSQVGTELGNKRGVLPILQSTAFGVRGKFQISIPVLGSSVGDWVGPLQVQRGEQGFNANLIRDGGKRGTIPPRVRRLL